MESRLVANEAMERWTAVQLVLAAGAVPLLASAVRRAERLFAPGKPMVDDPTDRRMPVVFLAHGSPLLLDDSGWMSELAHRARAMPRPSAVLMAIIGFLAGSLTRRSVQFG